MSKAEGFAAVPNWMVRDKSVPRSAVLVYASLASRSGPGGIFPSQAVIAEESGLSERTVRTMLAHLESIGVVARVRRKRKTGRGRLSDGYTLHPNGSIAVIEDAENYAASVAGRSDQPANETRPTGNELQITPLIEVEPPQVEPPTFDDFWALWPKKNAKKDAERAWARAVKKADPHTILDRVRAYAQSPGRPELQYVPYAASWLNGERWTDPLPDATQHRGARTFAQQKQDNNVALLERYREGGGRGEVGSGGARGLRAVDSGA